MIFDSFNEISILISNHFTGYFLNPGCIAKYTEYFSIIATGAAAFEALWFHTIFFPLRHDTFWNWLKESPDTLVLAAWSDSWTILSEIEIASHIC